MAAVLASAATAGDAATCGNSRPCTCGDVVRSDLVLTADIGPCPDSGIRVASGVRLDCGRHIIQGTDGPPWKDVGPAGKQSAGIVLDGASGATVRNCVVRHFARGVRVRGGARNTIEYTVAHGNRRYGIDLAEGTRGNTIHGVRVFGNGDEGIHVGTGAAFNWISQSDIYDNGRENLYLLAATGTMVLDNRIGGYTPTGLYNKHSSRGRFARNTFRGGTVAIVGASGGNLFADNDLDGARLVLRSYRDGTAPHGNVIRGGTIAHAPVCVHLQDVRDNVLEGITIGPCGEALVATGMHTENTVISMRLPRRAVRLAEGALLHIGWRLGVRVVGESRTGLAKARVDIQDSTGARVASMVTDGAGQLGPVTLVGSTWTAGREIPGGRYELAVSAAGFVPRKVQVEARQDESLLLVLVRDTQNRGEARRGTGHAAAD